MPFQVQSITKHEARKIAIVQTGLNSWQGKGELGIKRVLQKFGMVQLDPLNPAGRNHDYFFSTRLPDYKAGNYEKTAYKERLVFEAYLPNLMGVAIEHFPLMYSKMTRSNLHPYWLKRLKELEKVHPTILNEAYAVLKEKKIAKSDDLKEKFTNNNIVQIWKTKNLAGVLLEFLWVLGKAAIVKRDKNFRKYYCCIEDYITDDYKQKIVLNDEEHKRKIFMLKLKYHGVIDIGAVKYKEKELLLKKRSLKAEWFDSDLHPDAPHLLQIEGSRKTIAVFPNWTEALKRDFDKEMRVLGPLEPLIWDRQLTESIFDFEYAWEVYKRKHERKWGYYVFPLLYKDNLIGRIEAKFERDKNLLKLFNFRVESNFTLDNEATAAMTRMVERWKNFVEAKNVKTDHSLQYILKE